MRQKFREIQQESGAEVKVGLAVGESNTVPVYIIGTWDECDRARGLIHKLEKAQAETCADDGFDRSQWDVVVEDEARVWRPPEDPYADASPPAGDMKGGWGKGGGFEADPFSMKGGKKGGKGWGKDGGNYLIYHKKNNLQS